MEGVEKFSAVENRVAPPLRSLCLEFFLNNFDDFLQQFTENCSFPVPLDDKLNNLHPDLKLTIVALTKKRKRLSDMLLSILADSSWKTLDLSGSNISDAGLEEVGRTCTCLEAIDISRCTNITAAGVGKLLSSIPVLKTLRFGGCNISDDIATDCCLTIIKETLEERISKINEIPYLQGEWEELDTEVGFSCNFFFLVWPSIDIDSRWHLQKCRILNMNPQPPADGSRTIPKEAMPNIVLDERLLAEW